MRNKATALQSNGNGMNISTKAPRYSIPAKKTHMEKPTRYWNEKSMFVMPISKKKRMSSVISRDIRTLSFHLSCHSSENFVFLALHLFVIQFDIKL